MKAPGLIDGVVVAVCIALGSGLASLLLGGFVGRGALFDLLLPLAALAYLVYLLRRSGARVGRVVLPAAWGIVSLAGWLLELSFFQQVVAQAGLLWLARSLYFHGTLSAALLDLGLVASGLLAAAWALLNTGSISAALWSFFLLQALFVWIPSFAPPQQNDPFYRRDDASRFQSAHRVAVDAVRKLTQP